MGEGVVAIVVKSTSRVWMHGEEESWSKIECCLLLAAATGKIEFALKWGRGKLGVKDSTERAGTIRMKFNFNINVNVNVNVLGMFY